MRPMFLLRAALLLSLLLSPAIIVAHDSPEHVIEILTARMETVGERPDLLWRRATEHRALADHAAAARDLKRAIKLRGDYLPALIDLSRVRLTQGRRSEALRTIERAMSLVSDEPSRAPLRMIKAEIFADSGNLAAALGECDRALAGAGVAELDWYLTRSQIQCRLGQFAEAAEGLQRGFELTGSAVLEVESIDAMIDAAQYEAALVKVEAAIAETRWQSSWLLRRARIRLGTGEVAAGHHDLAAAIVEMNRRLNPAHPESGLLSERGFAYALLGDLALAKRDLASAKRRGAEPVSLRRLELALASQR